MLTQRSRQKELLDLGPDHYSHSEYVECLKKLFVVNKFLGFFHGTVKTLKKLGVNGSLLDIGCGGGLFLLHLSKHFPHMRMIGKDINATAISVAQQTLQNWQKNKPGIKVSFQLQQQPQLNLDENSFEIILATLVCHHLGDEELVDFLKNTYQAASQTVIINDLQRHRLASWLFGLISPLLFRNRLITHDGLISILRSFTRLEWELLLKKAGIPTYQIKWCFPFRWRVILWK